MEYHITKSKFNPIDLYTQKRKLIIELCSFNYHVDVIIENFVVDENGIVFMIDYGNSRVMTNIDDDSWFY